MQRDIEIVLLAGAQAAEKIARATVAIDLCDLTDLGIVRRNVVQIGNSATN